MKKQNRSDSACSLLSSRRDGTRGAVILDGLCRGDGIGLRLETPHDPHSLADWVGEITLAAAQRTTNTLSLALVVSRARESLRKSRQWSRLWRSPAPRLPFGKRKAERLALVGEELGKQSAAGWSHFPGSLRTLHCLAQIGWPMVERLLEGGRIHPALKWLEAKALLAEFRPWAMKTPPASTLERRLANFTRFVRSHTAASSLEERGMLSARMLDLAAEVSRAPAPTPTAEI